MAEPMSTYEIGKPVEHRTLSFLTAAEPAPVPVEREFVARVAPAEDVDRRAIWVVHGMGQQVPFETLDALAQGVLDALPFNTHGWQLKLPPRVVSAKFSSADSPSKTQIVQRVEIDLEHFDIIPNRLELHLYEAYWAPVTEGVAKLTDVLSFLYDGALHGLLNCRRPFHRAMFPDDVSPVIKPAPNDGKCDAGFWNFRIPHITALQICAALLIVFALGAINAVIVAASAAKLKFVSFGSWPISDHWDQLTAIASAITALALTFGAVLFLAEMSEPAIAPPAVRNAIRSFARAYRKLMPSHLKATDEKAAVNSAEKDPLVDWFWSGAKRKITALSWISLTITAVAIVMGAILLTLISRFPGVARWFHGMHYHATQFVSTLGILLALALCAFAAWRRAYKRSQDEDHREGVFPLLLFLFAFLLHIALFCLLVVVQFPRFFHPVALITGLKYVIDLLGYPLWVWPSLLYVSKQLNDLIVEYPGDVAIYVAPNKLDRFDEARQKIKQLALDSLMPLYSACGATPDVPLYSQVAVVGHSLGSVIAYDTLNKLLTLDKLLNNQFGVASRTCLLETFGSPLDKTAFFFSYQGTENFNIREQLAACVQPLIQSYGGYRKFPWINVYSRNDIISGQLKFYDVNPPNSADPRAAFPVGNIPDPEAIVPLVAHVDYWKNRTLWNLMIAHILP